MNPSDSFDALAASIERALRSDLAPPGSTSELADSIDRIMREEARAGELRLGYLRLIVVGSFLLMLAERVMSPAADSSPARAAQALLALGWLAAASGLVVALRRGWYRRWVPHLAPVVDATMIALAFLLMWSEGNLSGLSRETLVGYVTALCAFLTLSGALRLSRWGARAGTALALAVFLLAALVMHLAPLSTLGIMMILLATGLLGASVTALIRRVVTDEVARATLSLMYKEASATIDAREQVLKIVSHDLRNPLHTISMCASLLLDVPMQATEQGGHLKRIKRAGERMNRLIQDLLDVAKLEAGRVGIDAREIQIAPLLQEAQEMLAPLAGEKNIHLECVVPPSLPAVTADAGRVLQVLSNLVGNAVKFTPTGGRITIRAEPAMDGVQLSVSDTGAGIPEEQLTKLFGRFWQGDPTDRRGIGLGLTIAKGIIDAHGGRIWVESRVGAGTTFHFTLGTVLTPSPSSGGHQRRRPPVTAPSNAS